MAEEYLTRFVNLDDEDADDAFGGDDDELETEKEPDEEVADDDGVEIEEE